MTSHEYAEKLQRISTALLNRPVFELPSYDSGSLYLSYFSDKEPFLTAVKSLGAGKKEMDHDRVTFLPSFGGLRLTVSRDAVCRKVREAEYDCEPLLSQIEFEQLDKGEEIPF